jgi:hypothetical protein
MLIFSLKSVVNCEQAHPNAIVFKWFSHQTFSCIAVAFQAFPYHSCICRPFLILPGIDNLLPKWPINHINLELFLADFDWTSRQCWICSCNVPNWTLCAFWRLENHFSNLFYYVLLLFDIFFWIHIIVYTCWKVTFLKLGLWLLFAPNNIFVLLCVFFLLVELCIVVCTVMQWLWSFVGCSLFLCTCLDCLDRD